MSGFNASANAPSYTSMTVTWLAQPRATSYVVKYTESLNPYAAPITTTGTSATFQVIPQETVCIQMQAVNSDGPSAWYPASPDCILNWPS